MMERRNDELLFNLLDPVAGIVMMRPITDLPLAFSVMLPSAATSPIPSMKKP